MEISCLSTNLCRKYFSENAKSGTIPTVCLQPNCVVRLSILDLDDDCLEEIFMHLNVKQLFDVIRAHTHFLAAGRRVLSKKFKHNEITVSIFQPIYFEYPEILHLVGDVMWHLRITYDRFSAGNFNTKIHDAVVCYCSDTLIEVTFNHIQPTMGINKTFLNLKRLNFNHGCVSFTMSEFNKWFPKLCSLQFFFCTTINKQCIEQAFPHLHHFTVAHNSFTFENLRTFLDLNPQLKTFTVYSYDRKLICQLEEFTRAKHTLLATKFETYPCYFSFDNN